MALPYIDGGADQTVYRYDGAQTQDALVYPVPLTYLTEAQVVTASTGTELVRV